MFRQRAGGERNSPHSESILEKSFGEGLLRQARLNLLRDGSLAPVLFVEFQNGEKGILPLELPENPEEKPDYFFTLGLVFVSAGKQLNEALMLSETWYVSKDEDANLSLDVPPREHPQRREAISLMGRNAGGTCFTFVVQPFGRDLHQRPVMEQVAIAEYNVSSRAELAAVGVLDSLFPRRAKFFQA